METLEIQTGRFYDTIQVLQCTLLEKKEGLLFPELTYLVIDDSRNMRFKVTIEPLTLSYNTLRDAIMTAYDSGQYVNA